MCFCFYGLIIIIIVMQAGEADEAVAVARSAVGAPFVANTHASIRVWSMDNGVLLIKFS